MSTIPTALQILSISASIFAAGGIASLTIFSVPSLQALPASRSLPQIRWLFSRGSHLFPTAAFVASAGFAPLAIIASPTSTRPTTRLLLELAKGKGGFRFNGYIHAAALCLSIGPVTSYMIPTNFALISMNEKKGGARSEKSAKEGSRGGNTAEEYVNGQGQPSQWTDLSGPQANTEDSTTKEEDDKVKELLDTFGRLNLVRAFLLGAGGVVGLATVLI